MAQVIASRQTLEQQRASDAWACSQGCGSDYVGLAKGLPAHIMNSGLMQVMAFLREKGRTHETHEVLANQLRKWLHRRFPAAVPGTEFEPFMQALMHADPRTFQMITAEAFAWLRWLRQIAAARQQGG